MKTTRYGSPHKTRRMAAPPDSENAPVVNPVLRDASSVLADITEAWEEIGLGERVVHEVQCLTDVDARGNRRRAADIRFEALSAAELEDIRDKLDRWANNLARGARARNTVDALRRDLRLFSGWCRATGRIPLPASQDTLIAFLQAHAESRKLSTLRRYLASIATLHSAAGLSNPAIGELVRSELDLIARRQADLDDQARARGEPVRFAKRQAAPLREEDLMRADALFGDSLRDLRDRAIVWMAFDTLARASELAKMRVADLKRAAGGQMTVLIPRSKSDQYGKGSYRYVSTFTAERLNAWLRAAGITEGYLFRGIDTRIVEGGRGKKNKRKVERVRNSASREVIYRAIKNCAARLYAAGVIQFDLSSYSAHSTRVGAAQDMLAEGVNLLGVQVAGGWKSDTMPAQYAQEIDVMHGGAAQLARKRRRAPPLK